MTNRHPHPQTLETMSFKFDANALKDQLDLNLNPVELVALNAWKETHLKRFMQLCAEGGIEKVKKVYPIGVVGLGGDSRYLTTLINSDSSEFNCEIEFERSPAIPQTPRLVDFRFSTKVTTLEGEKVNLSMFLTEQGEVKYEIQEFAEG